MLAARSTTRRTGVHLFPMIIGLVTTAPSQWKKFSTSGPLDSGEEIFVSPGKADDFVRKDRAADKDLVVIKQPRIDRHGHFHSKQTVGQRAVSSWVSVPICRSAEGLSHS